MGLSRTSLRLMLLVAALTGFALGLTLTSRFIFIKPIKSARVTPTPSTATVHKQEKVSYGLPVRIIIPKINIDAAIEYVGITPAGELGVPKDPANAAWYNKGPRPGEAGNAVIDGHFGYKDNISAVFDNLHKLLKGDKLYVRDEKGTTITFVVRELRSYGQNEEGSSVFVSNNTKAHLVLITCQGIWSQTQKSFSNRLVVFADKEIK